MRRKGNTADLFSGKPCVERICMGKLRGFLSGIAIFCALAGVVSAFTGCVKRPETLLLPSKPISENETEPSSEPIESSADSSSGDASSDEVVSDSAGESSEDFLPEENSGEASFSEPSEDSEEVSSEPSSESVSSEPDTQQTLEPSFTLWSPETDFVPEGEEVSDDFFSDALFIGNSRMQGFVLYSGLSLHAYTGVGLTVATAYTDPLFGSGEDKKTLVDALSETPYQKYYLMFGLNEIGWTSYRTFTDDYGGIIDRILAVNPQAKIYLFSILPLTAKRSSESDWQNNENVNLFNQLIWKLALDKGVYYLDAAASVAGADGCLPEEGTSDGVHLNKAWCQKLLSYVKTHTA